jgi:hypothetical protein
MRRPIGSWSRTTPLSPSCGSVQGLPRRTSRSRWPPQGEAERPARAARRRARLRHDHKRGRWSGLAEGPDQWRAVDRIEVTSVMWQDGVVEGDGGPAAVQHSADRRRAEHLGRVVQSLRAPLPQSIGRLRQQLQAVVAPDAETRQLRDSTLAAMDDFIAAGTAPDGTAFQAWLGRTLPSTRIGWRESLLQRRRPCLADSGSSAGSA